MDEVFTLSFFRLMHLPLHTSSKRKGLFDCFSSVNKKWPFAPFLRNSSQNRKIVNQFLHFYQFCLIFIGKDEVFLGLLCLIFCQDITIKCYSTLKWLTYGAVNAVTLWYLFSVLAIQICTTNCHTQIYNSWIYKNYEGVTQQRSFCYFSPTRWFDYRG